MEELIQKSVRAMRYVQKSSKRYLYNKILWNNRLIGVKGSLGTGKSTMLLQKLQEMNLPGNQASYWSLDDLYFTDNSLVSTAEKFYNEGGRFLFLDEVHKYDNWSKHVKNLYDQYPDLQIVFTGSSIIDIAREEADLSRRALMYALAGLSFREYLSFKHGLHFGVLTLEDVIKKGAAWQSAFPADFRPLEFFSEYLKQGHYPFSLESPETFLSRLQQVIRIIVEYDMASLKEFDIRNAQKMLQLLYIMSANVPFRPNISALARKSGIHRNTITSYLHFLEQAQLIRQLYPAGISVSTLQKPEKIYLNNTNLAYALATNTADKGNLRETFFVSQLSVNHQVNITPKGDFIIDDKWTFEVGGKNKSKDQIKYIPNSYIVADDRDYPVSVLPLWVFGMGY